MTKLYLLVLFFDLYVQFFARNKVLNLNLNYSISMMSPALMLVVGLFLGNVRRDKLFFLQKIDTGF